MMGRVETREKKKQTLNNKKGMERGKQKEKFKFKETHCERGELVRATKYAVAGTGGALSLSILHKLLQITGREAWS